MQKTNLNFKFILLVSFILSSLIFTSSENAYSSGYVDIDYLIIAGGGGGGACGSGAGNDIGSGGGAGGYLNGTSYSIATGSYPITIGAGGASATDGSDSIFDIFTADGGGAGKTTSGTGNTGGSGGGGAYTGIGGTGTQGNDGGAGYNVSPYPTGGGGGANQTGVSGTGTIAGNGGNGLLSYIDGSGVWRAAGGGGGVRSTGTPGTSGTGGGGNGNNSGAGYNATVNTGSGGGGCGETDGLSGGIGGSGIVIIRYLTGDAIATGGVITYNGAYTIHTFTTSGTFEISTPLLIMNFDSFDVDIVGDAAKITGLINITSGANPETNQTGITVYVNGSSINTNSTITNGTTPFTVTFGPIWYQITTSDMYNFTAQVFGQNTTKTVSNSSSIYSSWEYDPDYFTAIDPLEGLVNYTITETNILQVNRDTGGSLFQVECRYFTQAQAFLNVLDSGIWSNQSDVLYYTSDTSGFYYAQCYNSGELFIVAISQNYTNSLIPGLVIFDQLGGFFGTPSVVLVILSILSLGTGRNYPIILLIAASVTGILLALELLTLDPGLVVALIVIAGIGLFGIRKFY